MRCGLTFKFFVLRKKKFPSSSPLRTAFVAINRVISIKFLDSGLFISQHRLQEILFRRV